MARNRDDQRETGQTHIPFTGPSERYETVRELVREPRQRDSVQDSEMQTLVDVGTFRTLTLDDLAKHRHGGNRALAQAEVRNLVREGFLRIRTSHPSKAVYAALTPPF